MIGTFLQRISIFCLSLSVLFLSNTFAHAAESGNVALKNNVVSMEAGWDSQFLVYADGRVSAWGANKDGQLGDGTLYEQYMPKWSSLANVKQAASSDGTSYVLLKDGTVWKFGSSYDSVGNLIVEPPTRIDGLANITAISAGAGALIALKSDGTVWTLGNDTQGEHRATQDTQTPVQVSGLQDVAFISAGGYHMMALTRGGQVWTWGYNYYGAIGNGTKDIAFEPYHVTGIGKAKAISAGTYDSNALLEDGSVWNWGRTDGLAGIRKKPVKLNTLNGSVAISAGSQLLALRADGTVSTVKGKVSGLSSVIRISAGNSLNLAQTKNGSVYDWGFGYPGDGSEKASINKPSKLKMPLSFSINGTPAKVELSPMLRHGILYVSRSELFQDMGVEVRLDFSAPDPDAYNAVYDTWTFTKGGQHVTYSSRDKQYRVGEEIAAGAPQPFRVYGNYSNTTMFPLRFLCEKLGISITFNATANTVMLTAGGS